MDVFGLYLNIQHDERLSAPRKRFDERDEKDESTGTLVEFAELVLKNNNFNFNKKVLEKRGTTAGTKFFPLYYFIYGRIVGKKS